MKVVWLALCTVVGVGCAADVPVDLPRVEVDAGAADAAPDAGTAFVTGEEALAYVNPMIGTGGVGFAYAGMTPAVQGPLEFMRVGPDTTRGSSHSDSYHHFSGYYAEDPQIRGFSHTHFVGTGTADYGNLRVGFAPSSRLDRPPRRWWLDKVADSEHAEPGYYRVELEGGVEAELTASHHAAIHRYTVPRGMVLAIDPSATVDDHGILDSEVHYADGHLTGRALYRGDYVGRGQAFELSFDARIEPAPTEVLGWDGDAFVVTNDSSGTESALALRWASDARVLLRVAISLVSPENAARRLSEIEGTSFDEMRADTRARWREVLDRIEVAGGTETEREIFYTALYNCFRMPSRLDEYGRYPGLDGELHDTDHAYYSDLSLWDTYRTLHPLWTLIAPDETRDVLRSLLSMGADGGYIPRWPAALSYTDGMEGDSAALLFAEAATKGIDGVDYDTAFDMLLTTADAPVPAGAPYGGRDGIEDYIDLGWLAADRDSNAASDTLEYAVDDNALAELAAFLGRPEEQRFRERSKSYRNVWDPDTRFFRPRNADGSWVEPFSPTTFEDRSGTFAEGSAWHYRFYATHDPDGLIELFGGPDAFVTELEKFLTKSKLFDGNRAVLALPDPYYWHTNQPSLHAPFLFAPAGRWDLLKTWVQKIREYAYDTTPDGLVGNDDGGTLSAWYVLASIGLYPTVGTDRWWAFEPAFDAVRVNGVDARWGREPGEVHHRDLLPEGD